MKDMLGQEVVVGDTVIFTDYKDAADNVWSNLTGGVISSIWYTVTSIDVEDACMVVYLAIYVVHEFAYYTTIKDLTL